MLNIVERIEKLIIRALIILLLLAMVLGTVELGRITILEVFAPPFLLLDISKIFEGFGLALIILIGLELLKVLKLFLLEDKIKPEIIVEIAVIALCNKIITLDTKYTSGGAARHRRYSRRSFNRLFRFSLQDFEQRSISKTACPRKIKQ